MMSVRTPVAARFTDRRSGRVVFVSHCLLNENVRYRGGACRPGPIGEYLDRWRSAGLGICQMPCPEQRAWGGVTKRFIAPAFDASPGVRWRLRRVITRAFVAYTRARYALIARRVAREIRDYRRSGCEVAGLVGVAASPSCGISTTLDVDSWLEAIARKTPAERDAAAINAAVIDSARPGRGWFMSALIGRLERDAMVPPLSEHDLPAELRSASDS